MELIFDIEIIGNWQVKLSANQMHTVCLMLNDEIIAYRNKTQLLNAPNIILHSTH